MAILKTLDTLDLKGKPVLIRLDLNVPIAHGEVTDDSRIRRSMPTVLAVLKRGGKPILMSHLGRPKGKPDPGLSLKALVEPLKGALPGVAVHFTPDCIGPAAEKAASQLMPGEVLLLENLRFHPGEEANSPEFVKALAQLGKIYVNDAFSAAHRAHASTEGLAHRLPSAAGLLMQEEIDHLSAVLQHPKPPVGAVIGGAKISTKLEVLGHLVPRMNAILIGGGMANTFLLAKGHAIGRSLAERDMVEQARNILADAERIGCRILLPVDAAIAPALEPGHLRKIVNLDAVPEDKMILDIGPETIARFQESLEGLRTLLWNGPLGAFEVAPFDEGTRTLARQAAALTRRGQLITVAGGGDTVAALADAGVEADFSYISTAGGAFLEWLEGRTLPGVAALMS